MINILINKADGVVIHQNKVYEILEDKINVYDSIGNLLFVFATLNSHTSEIKEVDSIIPDFIGNKYMWVDGVIEPNPEYVSN